MTRKEAELINKTIAEWMGACWHEYDYSQKCKVQTDRYKCVKCGFNGWGTATNGPAGLDYTSESSPRSLLNEVEKKAIETWDRHRYVTEITMAQDPDGWEYHEYLPQLEFAATATALHRATAIYKLITEAA